MEKIGDLFKSSDWKKEKHVPVIECPDEAVLGEAFTVKVSVGKEIAHPNTTEHHIRWIQLFFKPDGESFPYQVGSFEFTAHGESTKGPNEGPVYAEPVVTAELKIKVSGIFHAMAYCNIHGLWENSKTIKIK
jgi:superoxide reductase